MIISTLCGLFVGCSKTDTKLSQSASSKSAYTSTGGISSSENEKSLNNSGDVKTTSDFQNLESWIGDYTFSEFSPPDENMFYGFSIYKENGNYYAEIGIDGFQTIKRLKAKVLGDEKSIKLLFYEYLPDNRFKLYAEGDILLSLEKRNSNLYTLWGKIQPMLKSNNKSGEIYFKMKSADNNSTVIPGKESKGNVLDQKPTTTQGSVNSSTPEPSVSK